MREPEIHALSPRWAEVMLGYVRRYPSEGARSRGSFRVQDDQGESYVLALYGVTLLDGPVVEWFVEAPDGQRVAGGVMFEFDDSFQIDASVVDPSRRGRGLYAAALRGMRQKLGKPIVSDFTISPSARGAWGRAGGVVQERLGKSVMALPNVVRFDPREGWATDTITDIARVIDGTAPTRFVADELLYEPLAGPMNPVRLRIVARHPNKFYWVVQPQMGAAIAAGLLYHDAKKKIYAVSLAAFDAAHRGKGGYAIVLRELRRILGEPILSDVVMSAPAQRTWQKMGAVPFVHEEGEEAYMLPNPPWADFAIATHWLELRDLVPETWLPLEGDAWTLERPAFDELGQCGEYGCVYATHDKGMVVKITTDKSEAMFAVNAMNLGEFPPGIVEYKRAYKLAATYTRKHEPEPRPVFLLWREEAWDVGDLKQLAELSEKPSQDKEFAKLLKRLGVDPLDLRAMRWRLKLHRKSGNTIFAIWRDALWREETESLLVQVAAYRGRARLLLDDDSHVASGETRFEHLLADPESGVDWYEIGYEPAMKFAVNLEICLRMANLLQTETVAGRYVGEALAYYQAQGVLLSDIHLNNIGRVPRPALGGYVWAITDPGHAVPLDARWAHAEIDAIQTEGFVGR